MTAPTTMNDNTRNNPGSVARSRNRSLASASAPSTNPSLRASATRGLSVSTSHAAQQIHSTVTTRCAARKPLRGSPARSPSTTPAATSITDNAASATTAPTIAAREDAPGSRRPSHQVTTTASTARANEAATST